MIPQAIMQRRQVVYWRMLSAVFGYTEQAGNFEQMEWKKRLGAT